MVSVSDVGEPLTHMWRLVGSALKFCEQKSSNMVAIILSPLQNLKWLITIYKHIKYSPKIVSGHIYMDTRFSIAKSILPENEI